MESTSQFWAEASDEALMEAIVKQNMSAFQELMKRHSGYVYAAAWRMHMDQDSAEDIVQETFIRVWKKAHSWDVSKGAAVSTWMYRIAYNLCIDHKRRPANNMQQMPEDMQDEMSEQADHKIARTELQTMVQGLLARLPDTQRAAIILCHFEGMSNAEAANIMGKSVKAVESLLVRARKTLYESVKHRPALLQEYGL